MTPARYSLILFLCFSTFAGFAAEPEVGTPTELGKAIEAAIKEDDLTVFERAFDVEALLDRCLVNLPVPDKEKKGFRAGFRNSFKSESSLRQIFAAAESYKFLRTRKIGTNTTLLFRLIVQSGGLNYHEHVLESRGGKLAIVDIHVFIMGELMSQTIRRAALSALAAEKPGFLDRLLGNEADIIRYSKDIRSVLQFSQKQQFREVLAAVRKLPESLQNQKFVLIHKLMAAGQVDEPEYKRTIAQWERLFPRDPSLPLVSLDGYVMRKDYDTAIKMLETLDSTLGGDPYLRVLQAGQYSLKGDKAKARATAEQALKADPTLPSAVDFLLNLSLEEKRFTDTSKLLLDFETVSGANMELAIKDEEVYAEFRSSEQYRKFLEARRSAAKGRK